jgi:hypothetical protein
MIWRLLGTYRLLTTAWRPPQDINPAGIPAFDPQRAPQAILLTGATGFLGMVAVTLEHVAWLAAPDDSATFWPGNR